MPDDGTAAGRRGCGGEEVREGMERGGEKIATDDCDGETMTTRYSLRKYCRHKTVVELRPGKGLRVLWARRSSIRLWIRINKG